MFKSWAPIRITVLTSFYHRLMAPDIPISRAKSPQLDLCIPETLRRAQPHSAVRKNTGPELTINNHTIPSGAFILYPFSDTLLNPIIYPDPLKWDPAPDIPQQKDNFIVWGGGKHMCKGQRLATLTMKIVVAYCLLKFGLAVVDGRGRGLSRFRIGMIFFFLTCRPQGECMIRFSERGAGEEIYV